MVRGDHGRGCWIGWEGGPLYGLGSTGIGDQSEAGPLGSDDCGRIRFPIFLTLWLRHRVTGTVVTDKRPETIRSHLKEARKRDLLTTVPGKAGGQLTTKAREITNGEYLDRVTAHLMGEQH
ncbi:hypothetical protein SVIO_048390 [Streptomyces violaceusniger]|uniref:Uncharacterized protein n=1 Tax=Streptomyces violaceusniger TaxID=68280 RepID=A0A4D4L4W8_STRVO|nr:hypothetical protein SVIO_048390 [Streptomyces violaceusniger]